MNIPTKITFSRIAVAPLFLFTFFLPEIFPQKEPLISAWSAYVLIVLYVFCELTDFLDGLVARKLNLVTDFGKLLDPFSDVLVRITYFFCFTIKGILPIWIFAIILYREFSILFVRMIAVQRGVVLPANIWGKTKSVMYALSAFFGIVIVSVDRINNELLRTTLPYSMFFAIVQFLFILCAIMSVVSFFTYVAPLTKKTKQPKK